MRAGLRPSVAAENVQGAGCVKSVRLIVLLQKMLQCDLWAKLARQVLYRLPELFWWLVAALTMLRAMKVRS